MFLIYEYLCEYCEINKWSFKRLIVRDSVQHQFDEKSSGTKVGREGGFWRTFLVHFWRIQKLTKLHRERFSNMENYVVQ